MFFPAALIYVENNQDTKVPFFKLAVKISKYTQTKKDDST